MEKLQQIPLRCPPLASRLYGKQAETAYIEKEATDKKMANGKAAVTHP
jgi:hypothetical protein